jgi:hypothetical protein
MQEEQYSAVPTQQPRATPQLGSGLLREMFFWLIWRFFSPFLLNLPLFSAFGQLLSFYLALFFLLLCFFVFASLLFCFCFFSFSAFSRFCCFASLIVLLL